MESGSIERNGKKKRNRFAGILAKCRRPVQVLNGGGDRTRTCIAFRPERRAIMERKPGVMEDAVWIRDYRGMPTYSIA